GLARQLADRLQVDQLQRRVGRCLDEDRLRRFRQRALPGGEVGAVDQLALDAVARQQLGDDEVAGAEERTAGDQAVARLQRREERGEDRAHAAGGGVALLGPLQQRQALLEDLHRGVAVARVDEARRLAGEAGLRLGRAVVDEAGAEVERLARLAVLRALLR